MLEKNELFHFFLEVANLILNLADDFSTSMAGIILKAILIGLPVLVSRPVRYWLKKFCLKISKNFKLLFVYLLIIPLLIFAFPDLIKEEVGKNVFQFEYFILSDLHLT